MKPPGMDSAPAEPEEEEPPDELDPESLAQMVAESDEWMRHAPDWTDAEPRAPGTTGPDLLNAARDTLISDDLSQLSDAELIEQARAARDLASMATGRQYRTLTELLRRRPPQMTSRRFEAQDARRDAEEDIDETAPNRAQFPVMPSEEAAGEIALAFTLTDYSAGIVTALTADLARRLPCALEGLEAGHIDESRVKIIWEYSRDLSDDHAARFDAALSPGAGEMTTGELRDKARREQIRIDPGAAEKRRKRGERSSKVVLYPNDDHTATLAIERAPAALAAAAKSRISAIARAAKAGGATDDLSLLESKVSLGLLTGTLDVIPPAEPPGDSPGPGDGPEPGDPGTGSDGGDGSGPGEPHPEDPAPGHFRSGQVMPWPTIPGTAGAGGPGCAVIPPAYRPKVPGRIRLLVPWRTLAGMAGEPGDLSWFGAVTPGQARELAGAAAADPSAVWRVIVTGDDGRAIAVTTLGRRSRAPSTAPGLIEEITVTIQASLAAGLSSTGDLRDVAGQLARAPDPLLAEKLLSVIGAANRAAAEAELEAMLDARAGGCAHTREVPVYRIPDTMRRRLCARDRTCRNPVCRRRAGQCDIDHTLAYEHGGRSCTCNTGPLCRHHHRLKQCPGWKLEQEPGTGTFTWTTPAGLRYVERPHQYAV